MAVPCSCGPRVWYSTAAERLYRHAKVALIMRCAIRYFKQIDDARKTGSGHRTRAKPHLAHLDESRLLRPGEGVDGAGVAVLDQDLQQQGCARVEGQSTSTVRHHNCTPLPLPCRTGHDKHLAAPKHVAHGASACTPECVRITLCMVLNIDPTCPTLDSRPVRCIPVGTIT